MMRNNHLVLFVYAETTQTKLITHLLFKEFRLVCTDFQYYAYYIVIAVFTCSVFVLFVDIVYVVCTFFNVFVNKFQHFQVNASCFYYWLEEDFACLYF